MKVNTETILTTIQGQPLKDKDTNGQVIDVTVKTVIINAILIPKQNETGIEKVQKYELAKKIYSSPEVDLTVEEIVLIKEKVGEAFAPIVVGQIWNLLEKGSIN